jgi:hypothetical protein
VLGFFETPGLWKRQASRQRENLWPKGNDKSPGKKHG